MWVVSPEALAEVSSSLKKMVTKVEGGHAETCDGSIHPSMRRIIHNQVGQTIYIQSIYIQSSLPNLTHT